jgi:pimeloyl-ACP methyl ester carboxylesterase
MNPSLPSNANPDVHPQQELEPERAAYFVVGDGEPVVMLHASLSSKSQWTALAERMARRFRVIALDLCGYGDNPATISGTSFTLDDEVRLITAYLDNLIEPHARLHIVGHSYGALVALRYAQSRSERVASLSLYEPVALRMLDVDDPTLVGIRRAAERMARLIMAGRRHDAAQAFVDFWSGEGSFASLPNQAGFVRRIDKVVLDFQAAWRWPLAPTDLRAIVAPTLLLVGQRSPEVTQRIVTSLTRVLPDCRVGWFECGHMGPISDAHRVNPWIEAFVDNCAARDTTRESLSVMVAPASWPSFAS